MEQLNNVAPFVRNYLTMSEIFEVAAYNRRLFPTGDVILNQGASTVTPTDGDWLAVTNSPVTVPFSSASWADAAAPAGSPVPSVSTSVTGSGLSVTASGSPGGQWAASFRSPTFDLQLGYWYIVDVYVECVDLIDEMRAPVFVATWDNTTLGDTDSERFDYIQALDSHDNNEAGLVETNLRRYTYAMEPAVAGDHKLELRFQSYGMSSLPEGTFTIRRVVVRKHALATILDTAKAFVDSTEPCLGGPEW
ncbi:MAG: hypothetical protein SF028_00345 [Candidatus Sumerlaeia bacterium]|nr:hypothetical protein [Candidatus Sumerlaeia bacterium]